MSKISYEVHKLHEHYPELGDKAGIREFGYYHCKSPDAAIVRSQHGSCYELRYYINGMQPYTLYTADERQKIYRVYGGDVFFTSPYEEHSTGTFPQMRGQMYWMQLDSACPALLGQSPEGSGLLKESLAAVSHHLLSVPRAIGTRMSEAFHLLYSSPDEEKRLRAYSLLTLFVLELAQIDRTITDENGRIGLLSEKMKAALAFIRESLFHPELCIDTVAEYMNYSRSSAMKLFRRELGFSIHEYILREKIDTACDLLEERYSVTDIALTLNFSSSQHFARIFRQHTGMSPTEYLRFRRGNDRENGWMSDLVKNNEKAGGQQ